METFGFCYNPESRTVGGLLVRAEDARALEAENARLKAALESILDRCNHWAKGPAYDVRHDVALIARRALGKEA